jgi:NADPH-dependent curcumin reductase CurA
LRNARDGPKVEPKRQGPFESEVLMAPRMGREVHLKSIPRGMPSEDIFELETVPVPDPEPGQVLVRQIWMSVDPYMRGRMRVGGRSYSPPFEQNAVLDGAAVGQVLASRHPGFEVGSYVVGSSGGFREYFVTDGAGLRVVDPKATPLSAWLGVLGVPGFTAWVGVKELLRPKRDQTLFVSGAAGAVGSVACQIAKSFGCRVIGSAGSDEKCAWLSELGIDAALNYKTADDFTRALADVCPAGLDLYFENVGGIQLEAALEVMNDWGRIAVCGLISQYNATAPTPGPRNFANVLTRRLEVRGFIILDHRARFGEFVGDMLPWVKEGRVQWRETVYDGLENAPRAFLGLFSGDNIGKSLVRIAADE